jgi:hypothetical protein
MFNVAWRNYIGTVWCQQVCLRWELPARSLNGGELSALFGGVAVGWPCAGHLVLLLAAGRRGLVPGSLGGQGDAVGFAAAGEPPEEGQ